MMTRSHRRQSAARGAPWLVLALLATGFQPDSAGTARVRHRTHRRLESALESPLSATWQGGTLRSLLRRLENEREISILLDRRVDPDQECRIVANGRPLRAVLDDLAHAAKSAVTRTSSCVVIAPPPAAARLRTLVALREADLIDPNGPVPRAQSARLRSLRRPIEWNDLDQPRDIVRAIAGQFDLTVTGLDQIPYDLWAGATIPETTAAEGLSLVLNQFDLSFAWVDEGRSLRIVGAPPAPQIERSYLPRGKSPQQALLDLTRAIERIDAEVRDGRIVVRGLVEQHETAAAILGDAKTRVRAGPTKSVPIDRQSISLQARDVSLRDLLVELEKVGFVIRYDPTSLLKAGIDLDRKVSIDVTKLPARRFFAQVLEPRGMKFHFEGDAVIIEAK